MIDLKEEARKWLIEHEHYEHEPSFNDDLESLCKLITDIVLHEGYVTFPDEVPYDPDFGDDKLCECGDPYYRHFDTYDNMAPVGCKYCYKYSDTYGNGNCAGFKEKK